VSYFFFGKVFFQMSFEADWPTRVLIQDLDGDEVYTNVQRSYPLNTVRWRDEVCLLYSSLQGQRDKVIVEFYTSAERLSGLSYIAMPWDQFVARRMHGASGMWGARLRGSGTGWTVRSSQAVGPLRDTFGGDFSRSLSESLPRYSARVGGSEGGVQRESGSAVAVVSEGGSTVSPRRCVVVDGGVPAVQQSGDRMVSSEATTDETDDDDWVCEGTFVQ
jgi:hypothetical protein